MGSGSVLAANSQVGQPDPNAVGITMTGRAAARANVSSCRRSAVLPRRQRDTMPVTEPTTVAAVSGRLSVPSRLASEPAALGRCNGLSYHK
jgi:hypothetical protein